MKKKIITAVIVILVIAAIVAAILGTISYREKAEIESERSELTKVAQGSFESDFFAKVDAQDCMVTLFTVFSDKDRKAYKKECNLDIDLKYNVFIYKTDAGLCSYDGVFYYGTWYRNDEGDYYLTLENGKDFATIIKRPDVENILSPKYVIVYNGQNKGNSYIVKRSTVPDQYRLYKEGC